MNAEAVSERLRSLRELIERAGGDNAAIKIVAVTKGFGFDAVRACFEAGLADFGENYALELAAKARRAQAELPGTRWHFLGAIQRNKVKVVAGSVELWHSVSRAVEGDEIARRLPGSSVLVQVDYTGRPGRGGCQEPEVAALAEHLRGKGLDLRGLMTVAPEGDPVAARDSFRRLRRLRDSLGLVECSMGMTGDLDAAVQEGATILRIGRGLLGPRPSSSRLRQ